MAQPIQALTITKPWICSKEFVHGDELHYCTLDPDHENRHRCYHFAWLSQRRYWRIFEMKCAKHYSKFSSRLGSFTEIRRNLNDYGVGSLIKITTPRTTFEATVTKRQMIRRPEITEELALADADCSRDELLTNLDEWYGTEVNRFLLLTLERNPEG